MPTHQQEDQTHLSRRKAGSQVNNLLMCSRRKGLSVKPSQQPHNVPDEAFALVQLVLILIADPGKRNRPQFLLQKKPAGANVEAADKMVTGLKLTSRFLCMK